MEIRCPICGSTGMIDEANKGRRIKCRSCGKGFIAAETPVSAVPLLSFVDQDGGPEPEPELGGSLGSQIDFTNPVRLEPTPIKEPWYYTLIDLWGQSFMVLAMLVLGLALLLLMVVLLGAIAQAKDVRTAISDLAGVSASLVLAITLPTVFIMILFLTWAAMILILVDLARNVRQMRRNSDQADWAMKR
jgi:hypothetical protein